MILVTFFAIPGWLCAFMAIHQHPFLFISSLINFYTFPFFSCLAAATSFLPTDYHGILFPEFLHVTYSVTRCTAHFICLTTFPATVCISLTHGSFILSLVYFIFCTSAPLSLPPPVSVSGRSHCVWIYYGHLKFLE